MCDRGISPCETEMSNIVRPQEARWLVELTDMRTCARVCVCVCTRGYVTSHVCVHCLDQQAESQQGERERERPVK